MSNKGVETVRGRPRSFDIDSSVDAAMRVFWKHGFDGASLSELTNAMGISRPSLYAAFGDKEGLFLKSLDHYRATPASYVNRALAEPTALAVFRSLLFGAIDLLTDPQNPGGCLFVHGALACGVSGEQIRAELSSRRIKGEKDIRDRYERAVREGDLPPGSDADDLAKYTTTFIWGLSVHAVGGSTRDELLRAAEIAIKGFPCA